jgi:hypothetical protein
MEVIKLEDNVNVESKKPIDKWYQSLGQSKGIQFVLWENSLQITRTEKNDQSGKWETKQEFNLAPMVLKELAWRIPLMLNKIEGAKEREN